MTTISPADKPPHTPKPMSWGDIQDLPSVSAGEAIAYGTEPSQFGELRLPQGDGPFPVVVLVHGGCWLADYSLRYFDHWAAWFLDQGYATWSVEYRRLGEEGGGWPGTFLDAANATDYLRQLAQIYPLDLGQLIAVGHSAGGQLALWLATRDRLEPQSPLYQPDPLLPAQVIGLAAITDMAAYRIGPAGSCHASVDPLLAGAPEDVPSHYQQTSPIERLPLKRRLALVSGQLDAIVSLESVEQFADRARQAGDQLEHIVLPGAGHFDTGVPSPASQWAMCRLLDACR